MTGLGKIDERGIGRDILIVFIWKTFKGRGSFAVKKLMCS